MPLVFLLLAFFTQLPDGVSGFSFVQRPDDPTLVIVGLNSSIVPLHWKCNLSTSVGVLTISRYTPANSGNPDQLGKRFGDNGVNQASFGGRGNMSGTGCEVTFRIFSVTEEDGKYKYRVRVDPAVGGQPENDDIGLFVAVHPVIDHTSTRFISKNEGSPFTLFCNATGQPKPTIEWKKISGTPLQFPDGESLTVNSSTREHNGTYQCTATNLAGSSLEKPLFDVIIHYPPEVKVSDSTTVVKGETVNLTCTVTGIPQPSVTWSRVLGSSNSSETISPGSCTSSLCLKTNVIQPASVERFRVEDVLTLVNVTVSMEGSYTCSASSVEGSDNGTININVAESPCKNSPCENNGTCSVVQSSTVVSYSCSCNHPWKGKNCIENVCDENNYCKNGGTCDSLRGSCTCNGVWTGPKCENVNTTTTVATSTDSLGNVCDKNNYCKNGGTCNRVDERCTCNGLWTGPKCENAMYIIIVVIISVVIVLIIVAIVVRSVKKKRCRKDRKVSNRDEHKLDVRQLSDPSVVPGAVGYNNPALERHYVDKGPTTATPQDGKSKKPEGLYAQVDKSKKSKKKKPGELLYADLAEFNPQTGPQPASAQQAVKKPEKQQNPDYASITDIVKERDGKSVKVPITATDQAPAQPEKPTEKKPAKEAGDGTKETPVAGKGNPGSEDGDDTANLLSSKEEGDNSKN